MTPFLLTDRKRVMISKLAKEDTLKGDWLSSVSITVLKMQMVISTNEENKYMQELTQRVRNLADVRVHPLDWIEPPTLLLWTWLLGKRQCRAVSALHISCCCYVFTIALTSAGRL